MPCAGGERKERAEDGATLPNKIVHSSSLTVDLMIGPRPRSSVPAARLVSTVVIILVVGRAHTRDKRRETRVERNSREGGGRSAREKTQMSALLLLALPLAAAGDAAATCSAATDCTSCAALLSQGCFWCYDGGGSCKALGLSGLGCANFSFTAPDCACQQFKTCKECATPKHVVSPACEWTTTDTNLTVSGPGGMHKSISVGSRSSCRVASAVAPFTGPGTVVHNTSIGPLSVAIVETPTTWFWGQCTAAGPVAAGLVSAAGLLMLCIACGLVRCVCKRCCCRRRRSERDALLLSVQGAPIRPVR